MPAVSSAPTLSVARGAWQGGLIGAGACAVASVALGLFTLAATYGSAFAGIFAYAVTMYGLTHTVPVGAGIGALVGGVDAALGPASKR